MHECEGCNHKALVVEIMEALEDTYIEGNRDPYEMARACRDVSVIFSKMANDEMFDLELGDLNA